MQVTVDMIQAQPGGMESLELGMDLVAELGTQPFIEEISKSRCRGPVSELIAIIHQAGDPCYGKSRMPAKQG